MPRRKPHDAVVIGAGPTGVLAACRLREAGFDVLLVDAGPRLRLGERVPEPDRRMWPFRSEGSSYDWYRVRAIGGRSLMWGGWAYRWPDRGFRRARWPFGARDLEPWYREVEAMLDVREGELDERYVRVAQSAEVDIIPKRGATRRQGEVWSAARTRTGKCAHSFCVARRIHVHARRATEVELVDLRTEKTVVIRSQAIVLAASPFETARILSQSDASWLGDKIPFVDHMIAGYLMIEPDPPPQQNDPSRGPFPGAALVQSFVNTGVKSTRRSYRGGFSIELNGPVPLDCLGVERMVPSAELSRHRVTQIHAIGELFANPERYIRFDETERDWLGRPMLRVRVGWSDQEKQMADDMRTACIQLADALAVPGSRVIPLVDPLQAGAGHEAGTCPMGSSGDGTVDAWGKMRALDNVWIADASVMPTAGDRHPTLTLLAHALRAAQSTAQWLSYR